MPSVENLDEDVFGSTSSQFLSPRKTPSRKGVTAQRSTSSLRGSSNVTSPGESNSANGQHSLAHELAVALMPEPTAGSRLLAEEFGIEYDEGAEGIDDEPHGENEHSGNNGTSFADELGSQTIEVESFGSEPPSSVEASSDYGKAFGSPVTNRKQPKQPELDSMDVLAQNLESTDKFLSHLRKLDVDSTSTSSASHPSLEMLASDVIRRLNETTRERETQLRELIGYEREFRRIAGEVGGNEVLGQLDELSDVDDLTDKSQAANDPPAGHSRLSSLAEEPVSPSHHLSNEWEVNPDLQQLGDEHDQVGADVRSPIRDSFPHPPVIDGPITAGKAIPQLAHIRTFTTSLVSSLTTISEQAQVNGAATTEAGRKIRALKNKIGGWRTDWDGAERSRVRIERWEAGIADVDPVSGSPSTPPRTSRRIDGRKLVQEHLRAFERALETAGQRTQAIMAAS